MYRQKISLILYRINALSRSLEDGLNKEQIAYKMVGGVKFYERAEIKDIISYLRLINNPMMIFNKAHHQSPKTRTR